MGNVVWHKTVRNGGSGASDSTGSTYAPLTGRLTGQASGSLDTTAFNYTPGGDRKYVSGLSGGGRTESQYYYRADGLLIAVDNRSCAAAVCKAVNGFPPQSLHGAFEDYRYDALGRRVLVRTRKDSVCEGANCESSMMWVVFDGSAIAAEIRGPGADGLAVDTLEGGAGSGPMYGTVEYLNGPTLDEPLEIQGILPYRTWRGLIDGGQCLDGVCGNSGTIDYPGLTYEAYLTVRPSDQSAPVSWHGSLFAEGQDDGGLMYRRNRYYDPATGQFTQEDPTGLAGGANQYGFAGGDPINAVDPFGTDCPPGKLVAICVIVNVLADLLPGPVPLPTTPTQTTIETQTTRPIAAIKDPKEPAEGTGDIKELVEGAKDTYDRLNGGDGDATRILKKVLSVGAKSRGKVASGSLDLAGGVAAFFVMDMINPQAPGHRCTAEQRTHGCVDQ